MVLTIKLHNFQHLYSRTKKAEQWVINVWYDNSEKLNDGKILVNFFGFYFPFHLSTHSNKSFRMDCLSPLHLQRVSNFLSTIELDSPASERMSPLFHVLHDEQGIQDVRCVL